MNMYRIVEIVLLPIAWATLVLGALRSSLLVSPTAYSVCGPWGCGPETPALIAMHAGWLAAIGPPIVYFPLRLGWRRSVIGWISLGLLIVSVAGALSIVAWQWLVWLPQAGPWSRQYIWQRCGFAIVTAVDWPIIPLLILSGLLRVVMSLPGFRSGRDRGRLQTVVTELSA